jgi:RHS repeat-associated protein
MKIPFRPSYTHYTPNILATYKKHFGLNDDGDRIETLEVGAFMLYGSDRLGTYDDTTTMLSREVNASISGGEVTTSSPSNTYAATLNPHRSQHLKGMRRYEITNHLGNVLATVSDARIPHDAGTDGNIDFYTPVVKSAQDYYPFGMQMPGRNITTNKYRFGFQGQEADREIYGDNNAYAFKYRMHDARIGRFWSLDPLAKKYPQWAPYVFSGNRVIDAIEMEGLEPFSKKAYDMNSPLTLMSKAVREKTKLSANQKQGLMGAVNVAGGVSEGVAGVYASVQSGGLGAALGGVGLTFSGFSQAGFGMAQIADAMGNEQTHNIPSGPGEAVLGASGNSALRTTGQILDVGVSLGVPTGAIGDIPVGGPLARLGGKSGSNIEASASLTSDLVSSGKGVGMLMDNGSNKSDFSIVNSGKGIKDLQKDLDTSSSSSEKQSGELSSEYIDNVESFVDDKKNKQSNNGN